MSSDWMQPLNRQLHRWGKDLLIVLTSEWALPLRTKSGSQVFREQERNENHKSQSQHSANICVLYITRRYRSGLGTTSRKENLNMTAKARLTPKPTHE